MSINEKLTNLPITPPFINTPFIKNAELFSIVNKYSDLLSPIHKSIFDQQKTLIGAPILSIDSKPINSQLKPSDKSQATKKVPPVPGQKIGMPQFPNQSSQFLQGAPQKKLTSHQTTETASPKTKSFGNFEKHPQVYLPYSPQQENT